MTRGRPVGLAGRCCQAFALGVSPALALALAACGEREHDPAPSGASVGEARALEEAAAMLDEQRLDPEDAAPAEPAAPTPPPSS